MYDVWFYPIQQCAELPIDLSVSIPVSRLRHIHDMEGHTSVQWIRFPG
jgi:hypothetical protein